MDARLTPREIECVRLAGQRLSNKDIARHLGIGHKTVQNHLANAYAKLGVSDRRLAAGRLGDLYPDSPIPIPSSPASASDQPVAARVSITGGDGPQDWQSALYRAYVDLGPWRRPRRIGGSLLWLICLWALGTTLVLGAGAAVMLSVFEVLDRIPQAAR